MPKEPARLKKLNLKKEALYLFSCCAVLFLLLITTFNFDNYLSSDKVLGTEIEESLDEKLFWEDFVNKNPEYLDGWIELTKIYLQEGDKNAGSSALVKAREIDPNSGRLIEITESVRH